MAYVTVVKRRLDAVGAPLRTGYPRETDDGWASGIAAVAKTGEP